MCTAMMSSRRLFVGIFVIATLVDQNSAHVRLTYPPARQYALDFLDNVRTDPPCGMEAGHGDLMNLEEASTINVSWHMAYAHQGGYKIELLEGSVVKYTLTSPGGAFVGSDDTTKQTQSVSLPAGYTCNKCTLRILRQAGEWGNSYRFWSCADVNIQANSSYTRTCSGHGTVQGDSCKCQRLYSGDECQNKDECVDSSDCSDHGSCEDTESTFYPRRQCYCQAGWFGDKCGTESTVKTLAFDASEYVKHELSADYHMYFKIVKDELEVVLRATGTSYVALGWRPLDIPANCGSFPTETGTSGAAPEPEATSAPEPEAETSAEPNAEPSAEPHAETTSSAEPAAETTGSLHPMDCTDIIIGSARGKLSRVGDYYTRDRSSPRSDAFYGGGTNSLTAAIGQEENGVTTILFRRKLRATEKQDHPIVAGKMHVIWSLGQKKSAVYYRQDELKYHGGGAQRGYRDINFHDAVAASSGMGASKAVPVAVGMAMGLLVVVL